MAEFARHLGVARSTVTRAVAAGRLPVEADGTLDFDKAVAAWHRGAGGRADVSARHAKNRGAGIPMPQAGQKNAAAGESAPASRVGIAVPGEDAGRAGARVALMQFENATIKLEMALRRGLRFMRADVRREAAGVGSMVRAGIERVIDLTAPRLAAAGNELERRRIIDGEVRKLRSMVKRELTRALRRVQEAARGAKVGAGGPEDGGGE